MKRKSLLKSILISSITILAAALIIVCLVFSLSVNVQYARSIKSDLYHTVATEAEKMNAWFENHVIIAQHLADVAVLKNLHNEELQEYLATITVNETESIMNAYLAWDADEKGMVCGVYPVDDDYVAQERGWYKSARDTRKTIITEPYIDAITGSIVTTVASPLISPQGEFLGVCGLDIEVTELESITRTLKADNGGYAVLIDSSENVVVHARNDEFSHRYDDAQNEVYTKLIDIAPIYSGVLKSVGNTNIILGQDYNGEKCYFPAVPIGDTGWIFLYVSSFTETNAPLTHIVILAIIISLIAIIGGTLFFYLKFTKRIKPLAAIENIVTQMSAGVLDFEYPEVINDEIGIICKALESTNVSLKNYIGEIERILSQMADGNFSYESSIIFVGEFEKIDASIKNICSAMQDTFNTISSASEHISMGSQSVASQSTVLANAVSNDNILVKEIIENISKINKSTAESSDKANTVNDIVTKTLNYVSESNKRMNELLDIMDHISKSAAEIVNINNTIEDIAFQTNIIALNASIESAKAGKAGDGFSVVSLEVRDLAEKSAEASSNTTQLINETVAAIEKGTVSAKGVADVLEEIVEEAKVIGESVFGISEAFVRQEEILDTINKKIGEISDNIRATESTAGTGAAASEQLDNQVEMLKENLRKFKM